MVGDIEASSAVGAAIQYLDTASTYDLWAQQYDTDGNFLTAIDSLEMVSLFPQFLSLIGHPAPWKIVDLGCGTGRNTVHLLAVPNTEEVVALDLSPNMLERAKQKLLLGATSVPGVRVTCELYDMLATPAPPPAAREATAVLSTLVVEHIPLPTFFTAVSTILQPGGVLLLTNMHSELGKLTQAGFIDPATGQRIRATSYAHSVEDVVLKAERQGFDVVVPLKETCLTADDAMRLSSRAAKYVGVRVWYGAILRKRSPDATDVGK